MLQAKNGCLRLSAGEMDYIRFGCGPRPLVMIPGVGDGLKTVKGMALPFALLYMRCTGFLEDGTPFYYVDGYYIGERYEFSTNVIRLRE